MKTCTKCNQTFDLINFSNAKRYKDGKLSWCKKCVISSVKQWKLSNKEKQATYDRNWKLLNKYNISQDDFTKMLETQDGKCRICNTSPSGHHNKLHVDHCHKTGKVRGLLCYNCNTLLGASRDSVSILENSIKYLKYSMEQI